MLKTGEIYEGFKLVGTYDLPNIKGKAYTFKHKKTNAKVCYLSSKEESKFFSVAFNTPAKNDMGLTHIIEHCTLEGSRKYPPQKAFFHMNNISVCDDMNAYTANEHTMYHFTTRNDKDFDMLFDFYVDSVFNPRFLTDYTIFLREGWHPENLENGKVGCSGIVFNEMKANMLNPVAVEYKAVLATLFDGTSHMFDAGGDITSIPFATWEMLKAYYKKYYHPSNCLVTISGDVDILKYLKILDTEYFEGYGRRKYHFNYTKPANTNPKVFSGCKPAIRPLELGEEGIDIWFTYASDKCLSTKELISIYLLLVYFTSYNEHKIRYDMLARYQLAEEMQIIIGDLKAGSYYGFIFENVDDCNAINVIPTLITLLKKCRDEGLDHRNLKIMCKILKDYLVDDMNGTNYALEIASSILAGKNPFKESIIDVFAFLEDKIENDMGYFSRIINDYFLESTYYSICYFAPDYNYKDKLVREVDKICNPRFKKWTLDDKAKITNLNREIAESIARKDVSEYELPALQKEDVIKELEWNECEEIEVLGKKYNAYVIPDSDKMHIKLSFDISNLSTKETTIFRSMADSLFSNTTKTRTNLDNIFDSAYYFKKCRTHVSFKDTDDEKVKRTMTISLEVKNKDIEKATSILSDVLINSTYKNYSLTYSMLYWDFVSHYSMVADSPRTVAMNQARAHYSKAANLEINTTGYAASTYLYRLMTDSLKNNGAGLPELSKRCQRIFKKVFKKSRMSMYIAGSKSEFAKVEEALNNKLKNLPDDKNELDDMYAPVTYRYEPNCEAAGINSIVQYNALSIDVRDKMKDFKGSPEVVCKYLEEKFVYKLVREFGNAYGAFVSYDNGVFTFASYRDPKITDTLDTFANAAVLMLKTGVEDIEPIKLAVAGTMEQYGSEIAKIAAIEGYKRSKMTKEDVESNIEDVLNTTNEDVLECAKFLYEAAQNHKYDYYIIGDYDTIRNCSSNLISRVTLFE